MKSFLQLTAVFLITGYLSAFSAPLSPEDALTRIGNSGILPQTRSGASDLSLKFTIKDHNEDASLYIFDISNQGGYVIASADMAAYPVLGYSLNGNFNPDNIPPQLDYWLNEYCSQIEYSRRTGLNTRAETSSNPFSGMEPISPLLNSKWNQGEPYNTYCYVLAPNGDETKSVTGCVATAMAQVMYYFKYPEVGHGEISYKHGDSGTYTMNFGSRDFDWNEMLPTYLPGSYSTQQGDAVAYLMKACGYSVKMDYSKGDAGANGDEIAPALVNFFGYDDAVQVQSRDFYTYNQWASMIYNNLKEAGPLVYDGSALDGGHSFVCDGYDGNGYFHFNWGWGGMSDGYYLLDALNPDEFGIGGAAGGYNLGQQVILNISPKTQTASVPSLMQFGTVEGKVTDNILYLTLSDSATKGFQYINPAQITLTFGLKVENITNPSAQAQYFESEKKNLEASQGSFFSWEKDGLSLDLSKAGLSENDEYKISIATNISRGPATGWSYVTPMPGKYNYVLVKVNSNGYEVINNPVENISVSDFSVISDPVYFDLPVKFSAEFTNNSSTQLTRNYSAVFFNAKGEEAYKMENYSINVDPGDTQTVTWTSVQWYDEKADSNITEPTQFTVKLYDNWQGEYVDGVESSVTVQPSASEPKVETDLSILNATEEGDIYVVEGNELQVSLKVSVSEGFFNHTLMLFVDAPLANGDYYTMMHKHFDAIPALSAGEEQIFDMTLTLDDVETDKIYKIEAGDGVGSLSQQLLVKFALPSGIKQIRPDSNGQYVIYNLNGVVIGVSSDSEILNKLPSGIYIINGKKIAL